MTVAASTHFRSFIDDLARSESGRLLRQELGRRWPETADELNSIARYALLPAGKLLRPIMTLHAAEAVGGDPGRVLTAALGMEYLHVATLVHDDIIDADEMRRGRPAVATEFGVPNAIVAGDHLIFNAFGAIVDEPQVPPDQLAAAVAVLAEAGRDLCRGQLMEGRLAGDLAASVRGYPEMIRLKTGSLFRAVCQIGALLGGAAPELAAGLGRYGEHVGLAFQIRDDLLAYVATPEQTGKPATSDLANGRPTLPLLLAYQAAADPQQLELDVLLRGRGGGQANLEWVSELLVETGAVAATRERMKLHSEHAHAELAALPASASVDVLAGIAHWTTSDES
ncbi:MAG TPA: polyprenyl synthetase family protein [Jatrophihabitans sp.]|jgi:geranylgeranyl diphosphate synthase type I|nr:polyprenyl synthetase family protein [Jatrophihabitans sp.]